MAGLRIANALGRAQDPLRITLDGQPWNAEGLKQGQVSALRRLATGRHRLRFRQGESAALEVRVELGAGESIALIAHDVTLRQPPGRQIRVIQLHDSHAVDERHVRFLHVGQSPRRLLKIRPANQSWQSVSLTRGEVERISLGQPRGYLPMWVGEQQLPALPIRASGCHVVILYDQEDGAVGCLQYRERPLIQVERGAGSG